MDNAADLERLARTAVALGHAGRLRVMQCLAGGPMGAQTVAEACGLSGQAVAAHLGVLRRAGLVERSAGEAGGRGVYRLTRGALAGFAGSLSQVCPPPVVSFVAKSGSGKTTFLEKLLPELRSRGLRVGLVKHHSHTTGFDQPGKDTYRMVEAGAEVVIGSAGGQTAVFLTGATAEEVPGLIARYAGEMDLVLTEGFRRGPYPKIEVNRAARSSSLMCEPGELLALVTDQPFDLGIPCYGLEDAAGVADFLVAYREGLAAPRV